MIGNAWRRWWVLGIAAAAGTACLESPRERLATARAAAEEKQIEPYLLHFTASSAQLLRSLHDTWERTKGNYGYTKDVFTLLPEGEIAEEADRGLSHVIKIAHKKKEVELYFFQEQGVWVIDGLLLPGLWAPLAKATEEDG